MALLKNFPFPANPDWSGNYVRVDQVGYNRRERVIEIVVGIYADEECAQGERPPIATRVFNVKGDEADIPLAALHDAAGPVLYTLLKAEGGELHDATDAL